MNFELVRFSPFSGLAAAISGAAIGIIVAVAAAVGAHAADLTGAPPSSERIIDALMPKPESPATGRFRVRGLTVQENSRPRVALRVAFAFDSDVLMPEAMEVLDQLGLALGSERLSGFHFRLEGHTDAQGSRAYNQALSERRAQAVRRYLAHKFALPAERLKVIGRGADEPLDKADPEAAINRRVEVVNLGAAVP